MPNRFKSLLETLAHADVQFILIGGVAATLDTKRSKGKNKHTDFADLFCLRCFLGVFFCSEATQPNPVSRARRGVINRPAGTAGNPRPPRTVAEFEVLPGVAQACADLKTA